MMFFKLSDKELRWKLRKYMRKYVLGCVCDHRADCFAEVQNKEFKIYLKILFKKHGKIEERVTQNIHL